MLAYRGSIAHNMYVPKNDPNHIDDVDLLGVVIPEPKYYLGLSEWGSRGTMEYKESQWDCVFYELRKFVGLLLQGNPNVMSLLWVKEEHILQCTPAFNRLYTHRHRFAGKHVYDAFGGYAQAQLEKMEARDPAELRRYIAVTNELKYRGAHPNQKGEIFPRQDANDRIIRETGAEALDVYHTGTEKLLGQLRQYQKKGENLGYLGDKRKQLVLEHGYDAKNAAHCIRLLRMCKEFLLTGEMEVYRLDAAELLEIKGGMWTLDRIKQHATDLFNEIKEARANSTLPEEPDREWAEEFLVSAIGESFKSVE